MKPARKGPAPAAGSRPGRNAVIVFAALWLLYGATIDRVDVYDYALQQFVIASMADRGTYAIGDASSDRLKRTGDTFVYDGRRLAAKQPGQFTLGYLAYLLCSSFGLTYARDRILASAVVTWLSSSLLSALAGAFLYWLIARVWGFPGRDAAFAAAGSGVATTIFPYSGVAHHDIIAASYLVIAFCLIEKAIVLEGRRRLAASLVAGTLLGLTLFTSMLPAGIVLVLLARAVLARGKGLTSGVLGGLFLGLQPLFAYNLNYFGNPFLQANVAGGFTDTFFRADPGNFLRHLNVYLGAGELSVLKYMPIILAGVAGIFVMPEGLAAPKRALLAAIAVHLAYILNIGTVGDCQYGPRYLIPIAPLAMLGLPGLLAWGRARGSAAAAGAAGALAAWSAAVNLVGALKGTMYCNIARFAFLEELRGLPDLSLRDFSLAPVCLGLAALTGAAIVLESRWRSRRG